MVQIRSLPRSGRIFFAVNGTGLTLYRRCRGLSLQQAEDVVDKVGGNEVGPGAADGQ
jgi:hypothetical protein